MSESLALPKRGSGAALRLVETKGMSRAEWLAVRQSGIGSSDAAAAVGLHPYKSPLALWMEKTGRESIDEEDNADMRSATYWGTQLEPIVAIAYSRMTGNRVRRVNAVLRHATIPFMLANIDREVIGAPPVQILECKTAGEFGTRNWDDTVPEYVQLQVQHQLAVTGRFAADVAVLRCGQALDVHRIERDDLLIERLISLQAEFWRYVETDTPPPADGSASADRALRKLYPGEGGIVDFSEDPSLCEAFAELQTLRAALQANSEREAYVKQVIQQAMGNATRASFGSGEVSFKRSKDSATIDVRRLLIDHPELMDKYSATKAGTRRFLVHV